VEPTPSVGTQETLPLEKLAEAGAPVILVINKIDAVKKEDLLAVIDAYRGAYDFADIVPISARTGENVEELLKVLETYAQEGPQLFPEGMVTDQPEKQICAEIIREKLLLCLDREIPHGTAVVIERFTERENEIIDLEAVIYCEKQSHKGMIIGKHGAMLKKIGAMAREDIEAFMGTKVYLQTWVKVKENWRDRDGLLKNFGFADE
jgi:GTP-binding protein Era